MILSTARDGFAVDLLVRRRFADAVIVRRVVAFPCDVLADWFLGDDDDSDSSDEDAGAGFDSMKSRRHELCRAHGESDGEMLGWVVICYCCELLRWMVHLEVGEVE